MSKNLLYFNLAIDEKDTSLGFTINWLNTIAEEFDQVDVISLRVNGIPKVNDSIKIYGLENGKNRISKYIYFLKKLRELTKENNYERCFSHMSPISVVLGKFFLVRHKIKTTLWFTHPGPKVGLKKLILYLAFLFSENVVTASENSFPFSGRKVATIGHSINLDLFNNNKKIYSVNKILVLSRISKSKNIEMSIDGFLNSDLKNSSIDIIGGPLNKKDKEYFERLKIQYKDKRVNFLGKVTYKDLPVIPFTAPRTKKLKIINFTKKLDSEIFQLVNVFKTLKLNPDNINLEKIENYLKQSDLNVDNDELIEDTSLRFQFLEELKNAIIFLPLKPPMQYYYVSSPYGVRIHPKSKLKQMHHGIDMAGTWQEEVRAPADGYISFSGRNGSFGKSIKIVHKHGVTTLYGHLHRLKVKKGDFVKEGEIIGKMGSTGRAVGAHLHYEIKVNKKSVNPYNFISIGRELLSSSIIRN